MGIPVVLGSRSQFRTELRPVGVAGMCTVLGIYHHIMVLLFLKGTVQGEG